MKYMWMLNVVVFVICSMAALVAGDVEKAYLLMIMAFNATVLYDIQEIKDTLK